VGVGDLLKNIFGASVPQPDDRQLTASSELALSSALRQLRIGQRGWVTFADAARLFSTQAPPYAFGEMDDLGKESLERFAADPAHRSDLQFMPQEARVYFVRKA
jgi:hypothetical protein